MNQHFNQASMKSLEHQFMMNQLKIDCLNMGNKENRNTFLRNNLKSFMMKFNKVNAQQGLMKKSLIDYIIMVFIIQQQERK